MHTHSRLGEFWRARWQPLVACGSVFLVMVVALLFRLGTLLPHRGYSAREVVTQSASHSLRGILHDPTNAPYKLVARGLIQIWPHSLLPMRLVSVVFGMGTVVLFYYLVHHWHGRRIAILSTLLLGLSSWFLHVARIGTPDVMLFGVFALFVCGVRLKDSHRPRWVTIVSFVLFAVALYLPGLVWFLAAGVIWQAKTIWATIRRTPVLITILAVLLMLVLLAPLAWGVYRNPHIIRELLGLPAAFPSPLHILKNLVLIPVHLFIRSANNPEMWLARLPLLTIFGIFMCIIGGYIYVRYRNLTRSKLLAGIVIISLVLISLGGAVTISVLVPFVYLVIAAGLAYFLEQWLAVFPRNPIARSIGVGAVTIVVGLSCIYNLRSYFVGWPHAAPTQAVFTETKPL